MMNRFIFAIALFLSFTAAKLLAADTFRNGGDSLRCMASVENAFEGIYVLDYLVGATASEDAVAGLADDSLNEIAEWLSRTVPALGMEFNLFVTDATNQIGIHPILSSDHVWRPRQLGLNNINDEVLVSPLPRNCHAADGTIALQQTVVREWVPGVRGLVFNYDQDAVNALTNAEHQLSFLLVHEWLWTHADNADVIRNLNWFIHSRRSRELSTIDVTYTLASLGFHFAAADAASTTTVEVILNGQNEPNGRPRFIVAPVAVLNPMAQSMRFVVRGREPFVVKKLGEDTNLCALQTECMIRREDLLPLPAELQIVRTTLADPIWDIKMLLVVE